MHTRLIQFNTKGGFPDGQVAESLPSNVRYVGLIPDQGNKIPYKVGQLGLRAAFREPLTQ